MRVVRRSCRFLSFAAATLSIAIAGLWAISRIASDATLVSQYIFWVPGVVFLTVAAGLWIASTGLALGGREASAAPRKKRRVSLICVAAGIACATIGLHIAAIEYRLHNRLLGPAGGQDVASLRILNWNASGVWHGEQLLTPILQQGADLAIVVDSCCHRDWAEAAQALGPEVSALFSANMKLMSRFAILRHGMTDLSIPAPAPLLEEAGEERRIMRVLGRLPLLRHAAPPDGLRPRPEAGRAWYIEFDTRETLGRTLVVWLIDLPSDIRLARSEVTKQAMAVIRSWEGLETVLSPEGVLSRLAGPGFPVPDIILGDFNIPRDSRSLGVLTLDYPHAHQQAGWGHSATYPRHRPLVHIDHVFVGPTLRARRYEIVDPGRGSHRMQVVEVEAARER